MKKYIGICGAVAVALIVFTMHAQASCNVSATECNTKEGKVPCDSTPPPTCDSTSSCTCTYDIQAQCTCAKA